MIDIVKIKNAAARGEIAFTITNGILYCIDSKNGERVIVGCAEPLRGDKK